VPVRPEVPELRPLVAVAEALGALRDRVVFIGGAIAPLLQTAPAAGRIRPTDDVDGLVASASYAAAGRLDAELRALGFHQAMDAHHAHHAHRWRAPDGTPFDLVPSGAHLGATGSPWDRIAIETAVTTEVAPGVRARHASAPAFLALKWAAFLDRGAADPFASHDLEDILALLASRPAIEEGVARAPAELRRFIAERAGRFLAQPAHRDLLAACLGRLPDAGAVMAGVESVLGELRGLR
jgi:hypothetical protein